MQIYCDESGGADTGLFLVASVAVEDIQARRYIKRFRKITGIVASEIKGSALDIQQKNIFLSLLKERKIRAAISICNREDPLGGWAFKEMKEREIWSTLIAESSQYLIDEASSHVNIFPDGGRYRSEMMVVCEANIENQLAQNTRLNSINVNCQQSQEKPGIQIADVISNMVWRWYWRNITQAKSQNPDDPDIGILSKDCDIPIVTIELDKQRPHWLSGGKRIYPW